MLLASMFIRLTLAFIGWLVFIFGIMLLRTQDSNLITFGTFGGVIAILWALIPPIIEDEKRRDQDERNRLAGNSAPPPPVEIQLTEDDIPVFPITPELKNYMKILVERGYTFKMTQDKHLSFSRPGSDLIFLAHDLGQLKREIR